MLSLPEVFYSAQVRLLRGFPDPKFALRRRDFDVREAMDPWFQHLLPYRLLIFHLYKSLAADGDISHPLGDC